MPPPDRAPGPTDLAAHEARLEALVRDYARLVHHAIRAVGGRSAIPIADDIEQTVFLSLWQQVVREQTIDHPVSYVYQVAVRATVRAVAKIRRRHEVPEEHRPASVTGIVPRSQGLSGSSPPSPEDELLAREQGRQLEAALAGLLPDRRRAVRAHLRGFTVEEIMTLFKWDYQKARNLIARGMADLRDALRGEMG